MNRNDWEKQVFASNMNTTARLVAIAIGSHGNWKDEKSVWPSLKAIADMAGINRDTAATYVQAFEDQGWLRYIKTREKNVREYELMPAVADTIGILAKKKRAMSKEQLSNLSTTDSKAVAETTGTSCRNEPEQLPKPQGAVADTIYTNLKENLPNRNLKEEPTTSETPDAAAPVPSPSNIKGEGEGMRRFLNSGELHELQRLVNLHSVDESDASLIKNMLMRGEGVGSSFSKRVETLMEEIGIEVGEEW